MGIFDWILGGGDEEPRERDDERGPPLPSKAGAGPDIDAGRTKTRTEKDLRRVQGKYDPDSDSFKEEATTCNKPPQESSLERERRHINREDDPHFDPADKSAGDKIPGLDQTKP